VTTTRFLNAIAILLLVCSVSLGEEHRVTPATDLKQLCKKVVAGDSIVLQDGTWQDQELEFASLQGDEKSPISIVAQTPGKVVLAGKTEFRVSGQHVVVSGRMCV